MNILDYYGNQASVHKTLQITMGIIASQYQAAIASLPLSWPGLELPTLFYSFYFYIAGCLCLLFKMVL